jgi:hypothetical protein
MGEFFLGASPLDPSQQLTKILNSLLIRLAWTSAVCLQVTWRLSRRPPPRKGIFPLFPESGVTCESLLEWLAKMHPQIGSQRKSLTVVQHDQHLRGD